MAMNQKGYLELKINGSTIDLKLFLESEEFCKKLFESIDEDGISIFNTAWGHHEIKKQPNQQSSNL